MSGGGTRFSCFLFTHIYYARLTLLDPKEVVVVDVLLPLLDPLLPLPPEAPRTHALILAATRSVLNVSATWLSSGETWAIKRTFGVVPDRPGPKLSGASEYCSKFVS